MMTLPSGIGWPYNVLVKLDPMASNTSESCIHVHACNEVAALPEPKARGCF